MRNRPVKVLCVDDNRMVGEALEIKLRHDDEIEWLGQLYAADELIDAVRRMSPDVVLLDIDMPGKDPFIALEEITRDHPDVRVIMLTGHIRRELIDRAFEAGAWGYLSKIEGAGHIGSSIRQVMNGEIVLGSDVESAVGPW
jgi:DNA-binding NarL/FixJ family response regulator